MDDFSFSPKRRAGRPPKYDWTDKRDLCYKLYVEEQKSASEIYNYFAQNSNTNPDNLPCRKGFLRQFQVWQFPSHVKKLSPEEEQLVVARIRELWQHNVNQKDIKRTIADEGWELKSYEFTKLWRRIGLRLRNDQGYKVPGLDKRKRKRSTSAQDDAAKSREGADLNLTIETEGEAEAEAAEVVEAVNMDDDGPISAPMDPDEAALRAQRLADIQRESDQRLQTRKRRRRIRGYGHLPPDAPGTAPRYASETSLDECKAYLHLSNESYNTIRKDYSAICEDMGIVKKTQCAEGVWENSKQRLIRDSFHLSSIMHPLQPDQERKTIALDCLCCDVTKRLRVAGKSITIGEANNVLGLNPTESKAIRRSLYEILAADNFESRLVCGEDHWQVLRQRWFDSNEILQHVVAEKDKSKIKGLDLLCSDAMKRFREDKNKRGERVVVQKNAKYGPGPGPAWAATAPRSKLGAEERVAAGPGRDVETQIREPHVQAILQSGQYPAQASGNLIATLAQAAGDINFDLDPALNTPGPFDRSTSATTQQQQEQQQQQQQRSITAFFRLDPASTALASSPHPKLWLGKLDSASMPALQKAATCKAGAGTAVATKIHGVLGSGGELPDSWLIENDDELAVYLDEAGDKAAFDVVLADAHTAADDMGSSWR